MDADERGFNLCSFALICGLSPFSRRTLLRVFRSILRQKSTQIRIVTRSWSAPPTNLVNRPINLSKTKTLLQFHDQRDLITLPSARQPPAWIRIDKHTSPVIQMLLNNRKQLVARPATASSNRLPTPLTNRRPVMHRDRLRT